MRLATSFLVFITLTIIGFIPQPYSSGQAKGSSKRVENIPNVHQASFALNDSLVDSVKLVLLKMDSVSMRSKKTLKLLKNQQKIINKQTDSVSLLVQTGSNEFFR